MTAEIMRDHVAKLSVETADQLTTRDVHELCDAAEEAILAGGGFGWLSPPPKSVMEDYWRGVQMIPERHLIIARLDKVIAGSCQIVRPPRNNEAQQFSCQLTTFFVAPWARGHGLAQMIVATRLAFPLGFKQKVLLGEDSRLAHWQGVLKRRWFRGLELLGSKEHGAECRRLRSFITMVRKPLLTPQSV